MWCVLTLHETSFLRSKPNPLVGTLKAWISDPSPLYSIISASRMDDQCRSFPTSVMSDNLCNYTFLEEKVQRSLHSDLPERCRVLSSLWSSPVILYTTATFWVYNWLQHRDCVETLPDIVQFVTGLPSLSGGTSTSVLGAEIHGVVQTLWPMMCLLCHADPKVTQTDHKKLQTEQVNIVE